MFERNEVTDRKYAGLLVGKSRQHAAHTGTSSQTTSSTKLSVQPLSQSRAVVPRGSDRRELALQLWHPEPQARLGAPMSATGATIATSESAKLSSGTTPCIGAYQPIAVAEPGGHLPVRIYRNTLSGSTSHYDIRIDNVEGCLQDNVHIEQNLGGGDRLIEDFGHAPGT